MTRSLTLAILLVAAVATLASSQTILIDDFNDDDGIPDGWTTIDSTVRRAFGPGSFDGSSGAYHLEGAGPVPASGIGFLASTWDESSAPILSNGFLRATVRAETLGAGAALLLRTSGTLETGIDTYVFFASTNSTPSGGNGFFGFNKVQGSRSTRLKRLDTNFSFGVNEWWNIEAGAVGDELSMKVWRVNDPQPESPQLVFTDSTLRTGTFGVETEINSIFRNPALVSATFDDIHFTFPDHDDAVTLAPYDIYLWESPVPVPQVEGPFFVPGSPEKPDMRGDVTTADGWPDLRIAGQVTDLDGQPIPGLKLDFWQVDDQGRYDNSGGDDLRGHLFTDSEGNYELWTVMPANYESIRTRHLHAKLGGENLGFESPAFTTQFYFPDPFDNDINTDGTPDKVIEDGVLTDLEAIALEDDFITLADLDAAGAEFADLASNILALNNDPLLDGYFDTTLNIVMPDAFQAPAPLRIPGDVDGDGSVAFADFLVLSANFGMDVDRYTLGDLDGNSNVAFADFLILSDNFGNSGTAATAVPEPNAALLLLVALVTVARPRPCQKTMGARRNNKGPSIWH